MSLLFFLAFGCSEYTVREEESPPVAEPPTDTDDDACPDGATGWTVAEGPDLESELDGPRKRRPAEDE